MEHKITISEQTLKDLAIEIIIHLIRNKYKDKENIEEKITEIKERLQTTTEVTIKEKEVGSHTEGTNSNGKITIYTENGILDEKNIPKALETMIHELSHSVSNKPMENKAVFIEEGYVTYFTSLAINFARKTDFTYEGFETEALHTILEKINTLNGYWTESEVVRTNNVIMRNKGIDATYEYIMHEDGKERLIEKAGLISLQYQKLIINQCKKNVGTQATVFETEKNLLKQYLESCPLSLIDTLDIEMNQILKDYLVDNVYGDSVDLIRILEEHPELKLRRMFNNQIRTFEESTDLTSYEEILSSTYLDEIINTPEELTRENIFDSKKVFNLTDEEQYVILNMTNYCDELKLSNVYAELWPILYAYQICKENLFDKIEDYLDDKNKRLYISLFEPFEKQVNTNLSYYLEMIKKDVEQGKSRKEILEKYLKLSLSHKLITRTIVKEITPENYEEKIIEIAQLNRNFKEKYNINSDAILLGGLLTATKNHLKGKKDLSPADLTVLGYKLKKAFIIGNVDQLMSEIGNTPESIVIRSLDFLLPEQEETNVLSSLNYIISEDVFLGEYRGIGELDEFAVKVRDTGETLIKNNDLRILEYIDLFSKCKIRKKFVAMDSLKFVNATTAMCDDCMAIKEAGSIIIDYIAEIYIKNKQQAINILLSTNEIKNLFFGKVAETYYINTRIFSKIAQLELTKEQLEQAKDTKGNISARNVYRLFGITEPDALENLMSQKETYPYIYESLKQEIDKGLTTKITRCQTLLPSYVEMNSIVSGVITLQKVEPEMASQIIDNLVNEYQKKLSVSLPEIENKYSTHSCIELLDNLLNQNEIMPEKSIIKRIPTVLDCVFDLIRADIQYYNNFSYVKQNYLEKLSKILESHKLNLMTDDDIINKLNEFKESITKTTYTYS